MPDSDQSERSSITRSPHQRKEILWNALSCALSLRKYYFDCFNLIFLVTVFYFFRRKK